MWNAKRFLRCKAAFNQSSYYIQPGAHHLNILFSHLKSHRTIRYQQHCTKLLMYVLDVKSAQSVRWDSILNSLDYPQKQNTQIDWLRKFNIKSTSIQKNSEMAQAISKKFNVMPHQKSAISFHSYDKIASNSINSHRKLLYFHWKYIYSLK